MDSFSDLIPSINNNNNFIGGRKNKHRYNNNVKSMDVVSSKPIDIIENKNNNQNINNPNVVKPNFNNPNVVKPNFNNPNIIKQNFNNSNIYKSNINKQDFNNDDTKMTKKLDSNNFDINKQNNNNSILEPINKNNFPSMKSNIELNKTSYSMNGPEMNSLYTSNLNPIQSALYQLPTITNNTIIYNDYPYQNMYRQNMIYEDILPQDLLPNNILTISDRLQTCQYIKSNILDSYVKNSHDKMYIGETLSTMINKLNQKINEHKVNDIYAKIKSIRFNPYMINLNNTNTPFNNMPQNFLLYQSCYPIKKVNTLIECANENHKLNVRLYKYPPLDYYNTFYKKEIEQFKQTHLGKELEYYNYVLEEIIKKKVCPHFIISCGVVDDIKDDSINFQQVNNIITQKNKSEIQIKDPNLTSPSDIYYKRMIELYEKLYRFFKYVIEDFKLNNKLEYAELLEKHLTASNEVITNIKQFYQNMNFDETYKIPEKAREMKRQCINLLRKILMPIYTYVREPFNYWLNDKYNKDEEKTLESKILNGISDIKKDKSELSDDEIKVIYNNQIVIMLTEAPFCSLLQWMEKEYKIINGIKRMTYTGAHTEQEIKNILFQLLYTFHVIEKKSIYIPNFNLENNVFIKGIKYNNSKTSSLIYSIDNILFYTPNLGFIIVIDSKYNNNKNKIGDDILGNEDLFNNIQCNYENNIDNDDDYEELKLKMRDYMKKIILDLNIDRNDIIKFDNELIINIKKDIESDRFKDSEYMFRDLIFKHFKSYLNNRLGTALSTDEFKNLPSGDLLPLLEYKPGDIVLYKDENQYKFAQIVSEYDRNSPDVKYIINDNNDTDTGIKIRNIGDFFKYPNNDIKQFDETFNRTINNDTEIYKI